LQPIHYAAYLLHPKYHGEKLSTEQSLKAYEYLEKLAGHLKIDNQNSEVLTNIGDYRAKTGFYGHPML